MKTIQALIDEHGKEIRVRNTVFMGPEEYFDPIFYEEPAARWVGKRPGGHMTTWRADDANWELYTEPKPKVRRRPWEYWCTDDAGWQGITWRSEEEQAEWAKQHPTKYRKSPLCVDGVEE